MSPRLRVLIIVSGLAIGEPLGGAERFGVELARNLDQDYLEPIVCAFWRRRVPSEQYWMDYLAQANVKTFFATDRGGGFTPLRYVKSLENITACLRGMPVDVIHSHFQLGSVTAFLLKRSLGAHALVRTAHGAVEWEWSNTFYGFLCRQVFTKWVFPIAFDAEVGVSKSVVSSLDRRPGSQIAKKQSRLIYNGICPDRFTKASLRPSDRSELGISQSDWVVGSVGRLSEQKGYTYLIKAAPIILARIPNVKFVIVGDGELRPAFEQQVEQLGLSEKVIFTGSRQDVESVLKVMDLFVLPSLWEGLPTVILESMACGVPVIATDIPGTRELIQPGRTGWLVTPKDSSELAAAIIRAFQAPSKQAEIAQHALEVVVRNYSFDRIADQYETLYRDLLISGA